MATTTTWGQAQARIFFEDCARSGEEPLFDEAQLAAEFDVQMTPEDAVHALGECD